MAMVTAASRGVPREINRICINAMQLGFALRQRQIGQEAIEGMLPDSKVLDAPPHKVSIEQTVEMAKQFELLVLYTSTPGFHVDVKMAEMMKDVNPKLKVAFVGPPVTTEPDKTLLGTRAIDFVVRREFDYQIVDYA